MRAPSRFWLVVSLLLGALGAYAQQTLVPTLRGAVYLWEPYEFVADREGGAVLQGFDIELIREILQPLGYESDFRQVPDRREHLTAVENGSVDFTTSPRTPERERYAWFSDPIRREVNVLYVRAGEEGGAVRAGNVSELISRLGKRRVGIMRSFAYEPAALTAFLDDGKTTGRVREFGSTQELIRALVETKSIDAFIIDRLAGETVATRSRLRKRLAAVPLPAECSREICLMFSKKTVDRDLVTRVNGTIADLKRSPRYGQLVRFYDLPVLLSITIHEPWFFAMGLLGTFAFAISGVLVARREHFSLIGAFVMAALPTVGGGVLRDLIVQRRPVGILRSPADLTIIITVVLAGFAIVRVIDAVKKRKPHLRLERGEMLERVLRSPTGYALEVCDALGLSAFLIVGVIIALESQAVPLLLWGTLLSTLTACGGGIMRDVIRADADTQYLKSTFYAEVAVIWAFLFSLFLRWETWRLDAHEVQIAVMVTFVGAFLTRMAAVHLRLKAPSY